jgi:hypothetical protein
MEMLHRKRTMLQQQRHVLCSALARPAIDRRAVEIANRRALPSSMLHGCLLHGAACNVPQTTRGPHHAAWHGVAWRGIATTACSFSGLRMPFERLVALLEERGVHALVDAAQCARHAKRARMHTCTETRARARANAGAQPLRGALQRRWARRLAP